MEFREAQFKDHSRIADLHANSWIDSYRGIVSDEYLDNLVTGERLHTWRERLKHHSENQFVLMALANTSLVGFICVYGNKHQKYGSLIDNLHVASSYQGKGIGTVLMRKATEWLQENYPDQGMYLEVLADNRDAIAFYRSLGAVEAEEGFWLAPCGSRVKEFTYRWEHPRISAHKKLDQPGWSYPP